MLRSSRILALVTVAALGVVGMDARAGIITYIATLEGSNEVPPNSSPGLGFALVDINVGEHTMRVFIGFGNLVADTTVAHIHSPTAIPNEGTASVATTLPSFPGFPTGVREGTYLHTFNLLDASTYNPAFITANGGTVEAAETAFLSQLAEGRAYVNVHSTTFPAGEIRGFLALVPEPAGLGLMACGALGVGVALIARRRGGRRTTDEDAPALPA